MSGDQLIRTAVRAKFPGAAVDVAFDAGSGGYDVRVRSPRFAGLSRADREAEVYSAFGNLPVDLLAKIKSIAASVPGEDGDDD